jgi:predicted TIM-barrel fold metal-dependent hydrolase
MGGPKETLRMDVGPSVLVDSHFHIYKTDFPLSKTAWHKPPSDAPLEQVLALFDANGVTHGVVAAASLHGVYNDYVRASLKRTPRLRATAIVQPPIDIYQLEQMKADGFVGIRFVWRMLETPPDIDSDEYRVLLRRVADLGWHVHFIERAARMPKLIAAIETAGAKIVVDHMSLPDPSLGLNDPAFKATLAAIERGRTWVKLSAGYRFKPPSAAAPCAEQLVRVAGGERLFWGSDWPFAAYEDKMQYGEAVAALKEWVPDEKLRRQISGETPLRFYFAEA